MGLDVQGSGPRLSMWCWSDKTIFLSQRTVQLDFGGQMFPTDKGAGTDQGAANTARIVPSESAQRWRHGCQQPWPLQRPPRHWLPAARTFI